MPRKTVKTLRAIHPSAAVASWYLHELAGLVFEAHLEITRLASGEVGQRALTGVAQPVVITTPLFAKDARDPNVALAKALKKWAEKWQIRFDKVSVELAKKFADKNFRATEATMRDALKAAGFTISFRPTKASMAAYKGVIAENVQLIRSIPAQYLTGVQSAVWASVNRGGDMATLSKKLQTEYGSTVKRAALIARDQNNKAKATIENTRRQQLGITQAIWQHSSGGKEPRPVHEAWGRENKVFDLATGLYDPDEKEYVLPGTLINCRCTSRAIIPGFNDAE